MTMFFTFLILSFVLTNSILAQTYADLPLPENVLVVFKEPDDPADTISRGIKDYYVALRGIPTSNELGITLDETSSYSVTIEHENEQISGENDAAWVYVKEKIANVIENHLNTTYYEGQPLSNFIRYIVLCKGIPLKVKHDIGWQENHFRNRVSVDALLCLINQPDGRSFVNLYGTHRDDYDNPYNNADPRFSMDYRFVSNYFVNEEGWYLQYLVSRLDGDNLDEVIAMIDRSVDPDMSGEKTWIIDDDPGAQVSGILNIHSNPEAYALFHCFPLVSLVYLQVKLIKKGHLPGWDFPDYSFTSHHFF